MLKRMPAGLRFGVATLVALTTIACSTPGKNGKQAYDLRTESHEDRKGATLPTALSREMAWMRSRQVGKVSYGLWFGLDEASPSFDGRVVVNFELKDMRKTAPELVRDFKDLTHIVALDFEEGDVRTVTINGAAVNPAEGGPGFEKRYDGHRIYFNTSELLAAGTNRIEISFSHKYSTNGKGLHRFKDPADGRVYLYSDFEPYDAHRVFPCFDQPDIKASFELTVEAPPSWQVIGNTMERDVSTVDGRKSWAFPPSPVFSTYLFALMAGPYAVWKADAAGIPMRLFARQSLKPHIEHQEWFDVTRRGLEYFSTYFAYPYPYSKYDQIIVPEFNSGAMENVAAITFSERFVHRTKPTLEERRDRADVIMHEMAHQWFGNLVTMKWWNGLWLNESFATFMAAKAVAEATDFPGSWQDFYANTKGWAYWEDQLVTTHPIEGPVGDTDVAETVFDGITYGKGASVLKQLAFYLGDDDFREGLQRYFQKFALKNTTLQDFIKTLSEASGKDLSRWQKLWLQTSGVNGLRTDWTCEDGRISKFDLIQSPASIGDPELRPHRTAIAFYAMSAKQGKVVLRPKDTLIVTYAHAVNPVPEAVGKACPDFVFPNHEDYDYAKVELDPVSLEFAQKNLSRFESAFMRQVVWSSLWNMVVDGKLASRKMLDAFLSQAPLEKNPDVLSKIMDWGTSTRNNGGSLPKYLPSSELAGYLERLESTTLRALKSAVAGTDAQRAWFDGWLRTAHSPVSMKFARELLNGQAKLAGFPMKQPERWDLVFVLSRGGAPDAQALIDHELRQDPTDLGLRASLATQTAIPFPENKKKWLGYFLAPLEGPMPTTAEGVMLNPSRLREAAPAYLSLFDENTVRETVEPFFSNVSKLPRLAESPYARQFTRWIYPSLCEQRIADMTTAALAANPSFPPDVVKGMKINRQEEERCVRARTVAP